MHIQRFLQTIRFGLTFFEAGQLYQKTYFPDDYQPMRNPLTIGRLEYHDFFEHPFWGGLPYSPPPV
jgi:hypothetical protein